MWIYPLIISCVIIIAILAYIIGKKRASVTTTESTTTIFLIKSIQAIAELAVLEYITEGVAEIKEKKTGLITVRWKRGYCSTRPSSKSGFDLDKLALKKIFSLSYPDYTTEISILAEFETNIDGELPPGPAFENEISDSDQ
jgi:hypothetical protein